MPRTRLAGEAFKVEITRSNPVAYPKPFRRIPEETGNQYPQRFLESGGFHFSRSRGNRLCSPQDSSWPQISHLVQAGRASRVARRSLRGEPLEILCPYA